MKILTTTVLLFFCGVSQAGWFGPNDHDILRLTGCDRFEVRDHPAKRQECVMPDGTVNPKIWKHRYVNYYYCKRGYCKRVRGIRYDYYGKSYSKEELAKELGYGTSK